ncbi:bifunctional diguanylate cyclase/phosphodiesterase [Mycolicibacterium sp. P1-18]|uniref:putative bifunctional diguanylate cyclase/phosphodiesterase n=1 Tax=Mycolicibacterium sp. P1-18 TaxID=2024615 RepID=UPI0011F1F6DB|nr:bifunctional diguanylate cyclase/phosphodiesterase [Mycolicibacterium sp. P1-18]KAA0097725.1 bifunctional diguanylate cyclase/phosphodiesterase [Mycolicibacterium sp. P1-18]
MTVRPRSRATIAPATGALLVFASWLAFGWGGPDVVARVNEVASLAASTFATSCAIAAARHNHGRQRKSWACLSVGLSGWVASNLVWLYLEHVAHRTPSPPGLVDLGYLLLPVSGCAAALFVPYGGVRSSLRIVLDGVLVATALFAIAWTTFLRELFELGSVSGLAFAVSVAYPVGDTAMVTFALVIVAQARPGRRLPPALLAVGLGLLGVADSIYVFVAASGGYSSPLVTIGWVTGLYVIGLAGLVAQRLPDTSSTTIRATPRAVFWVPYVPVPFAVVLGARELFAGESPPIVVAGLVLIFAALARQFVLLDENRRLLVTVAAMALRDPLTDLANRALFHDRLAHAIELRGRTGAPVGVLVADLDDFKLVNDSLGHPAGDELLRRVGDRIQSVVRPGDTVARLGGDEFAILVEDAPAVAEQIADRVVRAMDEPFVVDGRPVDMRLSVGLATAAGDAELTAEELFTRADLAMYSAKRAHVGSRSFTPAMRQDATELNLPSQQGRTGCRGNVARIEFLADLRRAVDDGELDLVYQPKVDLRTWSAAGAEALIRWPHPELGLLEPADFLPLARENGLMEALTDFVVDRALADAAGWRAAGVDMPVAVNVSAPSLNDEALPARVLSTLARHGLPPATLTVEITEDVLVSSVVRARTVLDELRDSGVRVAIDDFGSGYAAMTYLHELPVDELKLDRQFVKPIRHDERAASIVLSVVNLANEFGLTCVAEGVEDRATADLLKSYGCGYAQGHYFSRPVGAQAIAHCMAPAAVTAKTAARPSWA